MACCETMCQNVNDLGIRIDAVIVSHEFTDHCHRATLETVDNKIPVYATPVKHPHVHLYFCKDMLMRGERKSAIDSFLGTFFKSRSRTSSVYRTILDNDINTTSPFLDRY